MTTRTAGFKRELRALGCWTAIFASLAAFSLPALAQGGPPDPSYNLVWEPAPGVEDPSGTYVGMNGAQHVKAYFPATGLRLVPNGTGETWEFGLAWSAYGYAGDVQALGAAVVVASGNQATLTRPSDPLEWYVNTPLGLQQWFSFATAPVDHLGQAGALVLDFTLSGGLVPTIGDDNLTLTFAVPDGHGVVRYNVWNVTGVTDKALSAELSLLTNGEGIVTGVRLAVRAAAEDYPIQIGMAAGSPKKNALAPPTDLAGVVDSPGSGSGLLSAPANDACADAITLTQNPGIACLSVAGTNAEATQSIGAASGCGSDSVLDVWYKFVAVTTNPRIALTGDGAFDGVIDLRKDACDGTQIICADAAGAGGPEQIDATGLTIGNTYYVRVYGFDPPPTGDFGLCVFSFGPPVNDTCEAALPLTLGMPSLASNALANNDYSIAAPGAACFPGLAQTPTAAVGRDSVWSFTAPAAGSYSFKVISQSAVAGGNFVLYTVKSPTCPAAGAQTCDGTLSGANRNANTGNFTAAEEVYCQSLAAGENVFVFADELAAVTTGGAYKIEVAKCVTETEPNNTTASANVYDPAANCPVEGAISPGGDVDFFSLGAPPAGSRVFAIADALTAGDTDTQMRLTTTTDTLEFDDDDNGSQFGALSSNISGRATTGVDTFIRLNHFNTTAGVLEPYRLYAVVQPPGFDVYGSSASEGEHEPNGSLLSTAEAAGNMFFSGFATADLDLYRFCANKGDLITLGVDADPGRNNTPFNPAVRLFSNAGAQLAAFSDPGVTSTNVSGAGSLTSTTPRSPGEIMTWRAQYTGAYYGDVDPQGGTSGDYLFSIGLNCQIGATQLVDIQLAMTDAPDPVVSGGNITYSITVTNNGPNIALDTTMLFPYVGNTTFVAITGSGTGGSWSCAIPPVGDVGSDVSCINNCMTPGGAFTFQMTVKPMFCLGDGTVLPAVSYASSLTAMTETSTTFATTETTLSENCDDGNPCTDDSCDAELGCVHTPTDGNSCDDGDFCTTGDTCVVGVCTGGPPPNCDDGDACTDDSCAPASGCQYATHDCNDGNACTVDSCAPATGCLYAPLNCDDGQCCTIDACNPASGCFYTANTAPPAFVSQPSLGTCPVLWPPNHKYADFTVTSTGAAATSQCGVASIEFVSCVSSQPENGTGVGDGNTLRDCAYEPGTLHLRAERDGACSPTGRVYSTQLVATDVCGNTATSNPLEVAVWHDRGHQPQGTVYAGSADEAGGNGGTYGPGCGPGSACANGTSQDTSDADPEMEISQNASISVGDLMLEKASGGSARLTWTEPAHQAGINVTRFHVYRLDPVTLFWTQIAEVTKQTTSYQDPVLNDGLNHQYKVTAVIK